MFNKLYAKIKDIIIENYKFMIAFLLVLICCSIELPFYINGPGGTLDVSKRLEVVGKEDVFQGSLNLAYVSELKATLPTLLFATLSPNWDILKKEEVIKENELEEEASFRDHLLLSEANQNAIIYAYQKAGYNYTLSNQKLYITYIDQLAKTDLKIKDQIIAIDNQEVASKKQLLELIEKHQENDIVTFTILRGNDKMEVTAQMIRVEDRNMIGIMISEQRDIVTNPEVKLHFSKSESGPSGGFMMALSIYSVLTNQDITHGEKIVGTGTIDLDGNVGSIGGVEYKLKGAVKEKADIFLVPKGENYEDAIALAQKEKYNIEIIGIAHFDEALALFK